jgi:AraC family transcriptional regulator
VDTLPGEPRIRSSHNVEKVERQSRTWNGITVHSISIYGGKGVGWNDLSGAQPSLSIVLDEIGGYVEPRLKLDEPTSSSRLEPRHMTFSPAGMPIWGYTSHIDCVREARLDFDLSALTLKLGEDLDRLKTQVPRLAFHDERIWQLGAILSSQCAEPDAYSQLYGDSLTVALVIDLLRMGKAKPHDRRQGGLARWQLRRVTEYMRAQLSSSVHLSELAEMTGLSQSQFGRAFKVSTGLPPHRWLLRERVAKAQELLREGKMSLAEIALATGFTEQSHLSRIFRQVVGAPPGAWQRDQRD